MNQSTPDSHPHERILKALNLEKHLTGRQIARLLYPKEYAPDLSNKAYQRVMKNLKSLETKGLLKSKSYGLGKEILWSLSHKKIVRELGFTPPRSEIHSYLYEHEKDLGDVFVSLALTETLYEWQGEGDQKAGFRFDRLFRVDDRMFYVERERGNQGREKLKAKLIRYVKHYRETGEAFNVLILAEEGEIDFHLSLFEELRLGNQYQSTVHSEFVKDPLNAEIHTRFGTRTLKIPVPNTDTITS